ncbi:MAG: organic hydroperoxide reductase OsmC/OhrA [Pseudohongiellaceae bacterium]|jgi:organic hydroperoxide reductase OsmC/OhrA
MSTYTAKIHWAYAGDKFTANAYSRAHSWSFDGGLSVPASASPLIVPLPMSVAENVDPEEAFVASISSCHMLWFLSFAANAGHSIAAYTDQAVGTMGRNSSRQLAMLTVELNPLITLAGGHELDARIAKQLHNKAHSQCFIANSVRTEIIVNSGGEL